MSPIKAIRSLQPEERSILGVFLLACSATLLYVATLPHRTVIGPGLLYAMPFALLAGWLQFRWEQFPRRPKRILLMQAAIAILLTVGYFLWHSRILVDDAGFIIRYLRQTDAGCWYCFNASEGPVFGISSFSHGLFTLLLYQLGPFSPEACLLISNVIGFLATAWLVMRILDELLPWKSLVMPLSFTVLWGAKSWMVIAATGMETPLHVALIMLAFHSFVKDRGKPFWLFMALAVVSKLDAAPIALAWGVMWLLQNRKNWRARHGNPILQGLLWAGIPLLIWIGFSTWFFGSPLPNSAASKLALHKSDAQHWFPFLERYLTGRFLKFIVAAFVVAWPLHLVLHLKSGKRGLAPILPGLAYLAVMVMYYFYNPRERMEWYYALPDLMLVMQIAISLSFISSHFLSQKFRLFALGGSLLLPALAMVDAAGGMNYYRTHLRNLESERMDIGRYIARHTGADDTLVAFHGLPSAYTDAFVLDMTALNSKTSGVYGTVLDKAMDPVKPGAVIVESYSYWTAPFENRHYRIDTVFYQFCELGDAPWFYMVRDPATRPFRMLRATDREITGARQTWKGPDVLRARGVAPSWHARASDSIPMQLMFGVRRDSLQFKLIAKEFWRDSLTSAREIIIPAFSSERRRDHGWEGVILPLDERYSFREGFEVRLSADHGDTIEFVQPCAVSRN